MSQQTAAPEPGWYPDFTDPALERWWDGSAWSPVTRAAGADGGNLTRSDGGRPAGSDGGKPGVNPSPELPTNPYAPPSTTNPYAPPSPDRYASGVRPDGPQGDLPRDATPSEAASAGRKVPGPTTPDGVPLAQPGRRLLARFLDSLITGVLTVAASAYYVAQMVGMLWPEFSAAAAGRPDADLAPVLESPALTDAMLRITFVGLLVGGVYSVVFTHLLGGTPGKLMVGIRVRSWDESGRPTWGQALARWLTREAIAQITFAGIGSVYWMLDSVWLLWDPRRQCLHDKVPATVVVQRR